MPMPIAAPANTARNRASLVRAASSASASAVIAADRIALLLAQRPLLQPARVYPTASAPCSAPIRSADSVAIGSPSGSNPVSSATVRPSVSGSVKCWLHQTGADLARRWVERHRRRTVASRRAWTAAELLDLVDARAARSWCRRRHGPRPARSPQCARRCRTGYRVHAFVPTPAKPTIRSAVVRRGIPAATAGWAPAPARPGPNPRRTAAISARVAHRHRRRRASVQLLMAGGQHGLALAGWRARWPAGCRPRMASRNRATTPAGSSASAMKCSTATISTATGRSKSNSRVTSGWVEDRVGVAQVGRDHSRWRSSPASMARLCATATGSMST